ncbi:NACHT domain-containing protein [Streptomyces scopuliridis]|uniref:NACHT domain-containing protein n=1 Tax=Streptomyces scopuliridis TaxID=452529 RepID=UPI0036752756
MSTEVVVARLAGTVMGAIAKSLLTPKPGAGLVDTPVRPLPKPASPDRLAKVLARRLRDSHAQLPEHERLAAVEAVRSAFAAAGEIGADRLFALELDPARLREELQTSHPGPGSGPGLGLSPGLGLGPGEDLYEELLGLCCAHVVEQLTAHPSFAARAAVEQTRAAGRTRELVEDVRDRVGPRPEAAALGFEQRYADYVTATQGRLELFGLTLGRTANEWPLDTAYISLAVSGGDPQPYREDLGLPTAPGRGPVKAEQALTGARRVVLRGPAGSGKSTLVQWLALNAARRSFPAELADWNVCVPFVLRLRAFTTADELPLPEDFLRASGVPLHGSAPAGWAERLLTGGRALVLVDGVDEVPTRLRSRTETWLRSLIAAFPEARYVVTTRPSAVPEDWLTGHGFTAHSLLPMERDDIRAFVAHWHDAARQECPPDASVLDTYEQSLVQAVTGRRDLGRLATNPLMCALLCALNRDRRMRLPRARKELYDAALDLLLVRRDTEREVVGVEGVDLTRDEQTALLQRLAYWLIRNGQVEAGRDEAVEMVGEWLAAMPQVTGDAEQVFAHLLIRSGLLREPVPGAVSFVHRTFQDYLGAKAAVEARDFGVLVRHAHDDQWDDVVRMAVGHARADERVRLLRRLLRRADKVQRHRNRLVLLAAASLEHAPELDPAIRAEIEERTGELVPPRGIEEAEELARVGELVLELLPGPEGLDEASAAAVVRAAGCVGGDAALEVISRYREDVRDEVSFQVSHEWGAFDTERYARSVLAGRDWSDSYLRVRTDEQLRTLRLVPGAGLIHLFGPFADLSPLRVLDGLHMLHLTDNSVLTDLSSLTDIPTFSALMLDDCAALRDLSPLTETQVKVLLLRGEHTNLGLDQLRRMDRITGLFLDYAVPARSIWELPLGPHLDTLFLFPSAEHLALDGIDRLPGLRRLTLSSNRQIHELADLPRPLPLISLSLRWLRAQRLDWISDWESLIDVNLTRCSLAGGLGPLAELPELRRLRLSACTYQEGPIDLSPLAGREDLVITVAGGTQVRGEDTFAPGRIVRD